MEDRSELSFDDAYGQSHDHPVPRRQEKNRLSYIHPCPLFAHQTEIRSTMFRVTRRCRRSYRRVVRGSEWPARCLHVF